MHSLTQTGGLLSDVFLHLVPHSFMGEHQDGGVHFVMVEEKRNILIGYVSLVASLMALLPTINSSLGIFTGFAAFFVMEKTLRVLGGEDDAHGHSHSHSHSVEPSSKASGVDTPTKGAKNRKSKKASKPTPNDEEDSKRGNSSSKLSAYLNLFGDFVHNMYASFISCVKNFIHTM